MTTYVCLLRGINVGGKTVRMADLVNIFESLGFEQIKTLLASGNVIFSSNEKDESILIKEIEEGLKRGFGFDITICLRTADYIKQLVQTDPFKDVDPAMKLFTTFLPKGTKTTLTIPYVSPQKDYRIISATNNELFLTIDPAAKTTDAMDFLDKKFGKKVTTRNWNTIKKISMLQ